MGNKETTLREIFEDIDTPEDKKVAVQELKNYLNDRDPKVMKVFYGLTIGEFINFKAVFGFMEKGGGNGK